MPAPRGKFVWYDVMTSDSKAAESFYRSVIGWDAKDSGMPNGGYTLLSVGSTMVGGLMPIPPEACAHGAKPCWTGYIGVDDVDAVHARAEGAGYHPATGPTDASWGERYFHIRDPDGHELSFARPLAEQ